MWFAVGIHLFTFCFFVASSKPPGMHVAVSDEKKKCLLSLKEFSKIQSQDTALCKEKQHSIFITQEQRNLIVKRW